MRERSALVALVGADLECVCASPPPSQSWERSFRVKHGRSPTREDTADGTVPASIRALRPLLRASTSRMDAHTRSHAVFPILQRCSGQVQGVRTAAWCRGRRGWREPGQPSVGGRASVYILVADGHADHRQRRGAHSRHEWWRGGSMAGGRRRGKRREAHSRRRRATAATDAQQPAQKMMPGNMRCMQSRHAGKYITLRVSPALFASPPPAHVVSSAACMHACCWAEPVAHLWRQGAGRCSPTAESRRRLLPPAAPTSSRSRSAASPLLWASSTPCTVDTGLWR